MSIEGLSAAAVLLNEKSDSVNAIISGVNEKLAALNLGIELWLEDTPLWKGLMLGYSKVEDRWQLALKVDEDCDVFPTDGVLKWDRGEIGPDGFGSCAAMPLLKASRNARIEALPFIPGLVDYLHGRVQSMITAIEHAKEFAAKL